MVYRFGAYAVRTETRVLLLHGMPVALPPRAIDVLLVLLSRAGTVVSKSEIIESVWPAADVYEANLTQQIYVLRRAFGKRGNDVRIENFPKRGYRLIVPPPTAPHARGFARSDVAARRSWIGAAAAFGLLVTAATVAWREPVREAPMAVLSSDTADVYRLARADEASGIPSGLRRAAAGFEAVIARAPASALGYAGLAEVDASLAYYATASEAIALRSNAMRLANDAVTIAPVSAVAYAARGGVEFSIQRDIPARRDFTRALQLDPNQRSALIWGGTLAQHEGRLDESHRLFSRAVRVAPGEPGAIASLAWNDFLRRDDAGAVALAGRMLHGRAFRSLALVTLANADIATREYGAARSRIAQLARDRNTWVQAAALTARLDAARGQSASAARNLARIEATADPERTADWDAVAVAAAYVAAGNRDRAYAWLNRVSISDRRETAVDPRLAALTRDGRFAAWLGG